MHEACARGHVDVVRFLFRVMSGGVGVNKATHGGITPLHRACDDGHGAVIAAMVMEGQADIHVLDKVGI